MSSAVAVPDPGSERAAARTRTVAGLGLSLLSAILLVVTFPQHGGLFPLVLVAFVPMYLAQYRLLPWRWSGVPMAIVASAYWGVLLLTSRDLVQPTIPVLFWPLLVLLAAACGGGYGLISSLDVWFSERTRYRWFVLQMPLWWVSLDLLLEDNPLFGSNGWIAYRLAPVPALIQPVSIVSTPALSLLVLLVNATLGLLVIRWWDRRAPRGPAVDATVGIPTRVVVASTAIVGLITVGWVGASLVIDRAVSDALATAPVVRVAAVQPTAAHMAKAIYLPGETRPTAEEDSDRAAAQREQLARMTRDAAARGATLIVWPEETLNYDPRGERGAWVSDLAAELRVTLVVGFLADWPRAESPNMAAVWGPNGSLLGYTYKAHPVVAALEAFQTPQVAPTFDAPFGRLGVIICFDHDFPDDSPRLSVLNGAQLLAIPAYDWGSIGGMRWQSQVFRAAEDRVPIVKAEVGYDSAIVAAGGRVLERVAFSEAETREVVLVQDVAVGTVKTPFTQYGGWPFGVIIIAATVIRYVAQVVLWRRDVRDAERSARG